MLDRNSYEKAKKNEIEHNSAYRFLVCKYRYLFAIVHSMRKLSRLGGPAVAETVQN